MNEPLVGLRNAPKVDTATAYIGSRRRYVVAVVCLFFLTLGCVQEQPTSSAPVGGGDIEATDFGGVWQLQYEVVRCDSSRPWHCPSLGSGEQLTLRVDQAGRYADAIILSDTLHVALTGAVASSGELVLQGKREPVTTDQAIQEIREMRIRRDGADGLTGVFQLLTRNVPVPMAIVAIVARAQRLGSLQFDDVSGIWVGSYVVNSCTVEVGKTCGPDPLGSSETLTLSLRQSMGTVTGSVRLGTAPSVDVNGTVSGDEIVLSGASQQSSGGIISRIVLDHWISRTDRLGQLVGTLQRHWTEHTAVGDNASTAELRLSHVARR